jgi:hypothetical protein
VQTQETWHLILHNPSENSLLSIDFSKSSAVSATIFVNKLGVHFLMNLLLVVEFIYYFLTLSSL